MGSLPTRPPGKPSLPLNRDLVNLLQASQVTLVVKNLPGMQETRVRSLGWKDLLEEEMATHSSILAWKIPWTEEPGRLPSMMSQRIRYD